MVTNNFKNIVIQSGCTVFNQAGWGNWDSSLSQSLYLVDMNNNKLRLDSNICPYYGFFYGACESGGLHMIQNYGALEDMIASITYYTQGARQSTINVSNTQELIGGGMIILGSGDTPPTPDDYKLDSWIPTTELYAISYGIILPNTREDDFIGGFTATYYNASQENKIVKEIGVISHGMISKNWSLGTKILMARDIFENPVIIKPKEGCTFSFIIK